MDSIKNILKGFAWGLMICAIITLFASCRTKYISVPEYHTEYITKTDSFLQHDSVYQRDSIFMMLRGDTVICDRWHTKYITRDKYITKIDTICRTDSISVPYEVVKVKRSYYGWGAFTLLLICITFIAYIRKL